MSCDHLKFLALKEIGFKLYIYIPKLKINLKFKLDADVLINMSPEHIYSNLSIIKKLNYSKSRVKNYNGRKLID